MTVDLETMFDMVNRVCRRWCEGEEITMIEEILPVIAAYVEHAGLKDVHPHIVLASEALV